MVAAPPGWEGELVNPNRTQHYCSGADWGQVVSAIFDYMLLMCIGFILHMLFTFLCYISYYLDYTSHFTAKGPETTLEVDS